MAKKILGTVNEDDTGYKDNVDGAIFADQTVMVLMATLYSETGWDL